MRKGTVERPATVMSTARTPRAAPAANDVEKNESERNHPAAVCKHHVTPPSVRYSRPRFVAFAGPCALQTAHHGVAAGERVQIDAVALAREAEDDLRVDHAFALHPLPDGPGRAPTRA